MCLFHLYLDETSVWVNHVIAKAVFALILSFKSRRGNLTDPTAAKLLLSKLNILLKGVVYHFNIVTL